MVTQFGWQRLPVHIRPCLVEHELDMVNMMKVVMVMITINEMKFLVTARSEMGMKMKMIVSPSCPRWGPGRIRAGTFSRGWGGGSSLARTPSPPLLAPCI